MKKIPLVLIHKKLLQINALSGRIVGRIFLSVKVGLSLRTIRKNSPGTAGHYEKWQRATYIKSSFEKYKCSFLGDMEKMWYVVGLRMSGVIFTRSKYQLCSLVQNEKFQ